MKNLLLIASVIVLLNIVSFAQDPKPKVANINAVTAKPPTEVFVREKFDPKRDAKNDLDVAVETAAKSGKHIILDIGGEWCGWCVYMDKFFYLNPKLAKLRDDNFVWVKVNYSEENENRAFLASYPKRPGYPHLFVLDETGKLIQSQDTWPLESGEGYSAAKFTEFLKKWGPKKVR